MSSLSPLPPAPPNLVKICGLRDAAMLEVAIEAGADMVGLVHFPASPRHVPLEGLRALADVARGRAKVVVLTVNPDDALVDELVEAARPDLLQLHGRETPERVAEIGRQSGLPLIKALGIAGAADVAAASAHDGIADFLLVDAKPPKDATRPGGLGAVFDWSLLDGFRPASPVLLSGGLGPTNVRAAISRVRPAGVDVSSGVETAPGVKDAGLIRAFIAAARGA